MGRDLAPSHELRRQYGHAPDRDPELCRRYREELLDQEEPVAALARRAREQTVTLLFAARDGERNNARVLAEVLRERGAL